MSKYRLIFCLGFSLILFCGCAVVNEPVSIHITRQVEETAVFTPIAFVDITAELQLPLPTSYVTSIPTVGTSLPQYVAPASHTPVPYTPTPFIRPTQDTTPIPLLISPTENNPTAVWRCLDCPAENGSTTLAVLENGQVEQREFPVEIGRFWGYRPATGYFLYSSPSIDYLHTDLWAYHVTTHQTILLLTTPIYAAQLSPDGITIAILKESRQLAIINPFGGEWLLDFPILWPKVGQNGFNWSPDGTKIAYYKMINDIEGAVKVFSLPDGQTYQLNTFHFQSQFAFFGEKPYWSADSQYVIYSDDNALSRLVIIRWDGSELKRPQLAAGLPDAPGDLSELFWTADLHTLVAYGGSDMSGTTGIWQFTFSEDLRTVVDLGIADYGGQLKGWVDPGLTVLVESYNHQGGIEITIVPLTSLVVLPTPTYPPQPTPSINLPLPTLDPDAPPVDVWSLGINYNEQGFPQLFMEADFETAVWVARESELLHRSTTHCMLTPGMGRGGVPPPYSIETFQKQLGLNRYELVFFNHIAWGTTAITYYIGTGGENSEIGLQVTFYDHQELCVADAEEVLATLRFIPNQAITPTP